MPQTIALVDDDKNILASLSAALEDEGYNIDVYCDGIEALEGICRKPVDLAVLDIKMPRMDGLELLINLRKKNDLPVIAFEQGVAQDAIINGINGYLAPCFNEKAFSQAIVKTLFLNELIDKDKINFLFPFSVLHIFSALRYTLIICSKSCAGSFLASLILEIFFKFLS